MGYQKFKLSDMIPNAWFFKLKDMSTTKPSPTLKPKKTRLPPPPPPPSSPPSSAVDTTATLPRKSYHITRDPPISPPRKSKSSTRKHNSTRKSNPSTTTHSHHHRQYSLSSSASTTFTCRTTTSTTTEDSPSPPEKPDHFEEDIVFDIELPRIATKPSKPARVSHSSKDQHGNITRSPPSRRFSVSASPGVRLKINSPRITARKQGQGQGQNGNSSVGGGRKSVSSNSKRRSSVTESFAVVKSSRDPQKDFRESMVEMIVQNNLRGSKDLEDLLACYLSLNSDEYHDVIIKVFKQIWFDFIHHRDRPHKLVSS